MTLEELAKRPSRMWNTHMGQTNINVESLWELERKPATYLTQPDKSKPAQVDIAIMVMLDEWLPIHKIASRCKFKNTLKAYNVIGVIEETGPQFKVERRGEKKYRELRVVHA